MSIRVIVIGAGRIGRMHADIISQTPGAALHGVVDRRQEDTDFLARLDSMQAKIYPDAAAAFADDKADAVCIATSSDSHVTLIKDAIAAGKKVFCEKPVAFTAQALRDLLSALPPDAPVQVGFNRRFDPSFSALKQSLADGALGRVYTYHIINRDPRRPPAGFVGRSGGMLLDFNVHDFDMLAYLSSCRVSEVFARGSNLLHDETMLAAGDIDTVTLSVVLENGCLATVDCARETNFGYDQRIEVMGEAGGLRADNVTRQQPTQLGGDGFLAPPLRFDFIERYRESFQAQASAFTGFCRGDQPNPVPLSTALAAVAAAEAGTRSLTSGRSEKLCS